MSTDIGTVPEGWAVLFCHTCPASVCWTTEDAQTYGDEWIPALRWAVGQITHPVHDDEPVGVGS